MSTRARVVVTDIATGEKNSLYRGSDGYLSGLGADLVGACETIAHSPDLDSFSFKLIKGDIGLDPDRFGDDACLDFVYTIEWSPSGIRGIFAQQVDWSSKLPEGSARPLKERVDVRQYVDACREEERLHNLFVDELTQRCGPCPLCGKPPLLIVGKMKDEFYVCCSNYLCARRDEVKASTAEEVLSLWQRKTGCWK